MRKSVFVVGAGHEAPPGEVVEPPVEKAAAFPEISVFQAHEALQFPRLKVHLPETGLPSLTRALIQLAIAEKQALGVGSPRMGIFRHDLKSVFHRLHKLS